MSADHSSSLQPLEPRKLFAASAGVHRSILTVQGTHKANTITIEQGIHSGGTISVTLDGVTEDFKASAVTGIAVLAGQGADYVFVENTDHALNQAVTIYGSGGADTLIGGVGKDRLYGGDGEDSLRGAESGDVIYGGAGNDTIDGGQGNDYIVGEGGDDSITGGPGIDFLYGAGGNDTINANEGTTDRVDGGSGNDTARYDKIDEILVSIEIPIR